MCEQAVVVQVSNCMIQICYSVTQISRESLLYTYVCPFGGICKDKCCRHLNRIRQNETNSNDKSGWYASNRTHLPSIQSILNNLYNKLWLGPTPCNPIFCKLNSNCLTSFVDTVVACRYVNSFVRYFGHTQFYYALKSLHTVVCVV